MSKESKEPMNADVSPAMGDALEGARRATANASPIAPPDPEVAATARRRQFTSAERARILSAADACKAPGEIGALLRREGISLHHRCERIVIDSKKSHCFLLPDSALGDASRRRFCQRTVSQARSQATGETAHGLQACLEPAI